MCLRRTSLNTYLSATPSSNPPTHAKIYKCLRQKRRRGLQDVDVETLKQAFSS